MAETRANVSGEKEPNVDKEIEARSNPAPGNPANFFALTISADTGEIVKVERVEGTGTRRDLRDDDTVGWAAPTLDALIERAFEAGIACVLGVRAEREESEESDDEADLRRTLLTPLMESTQAKDLLKPDVLGKAILATALAQLVTARTPNRGKGGRQQKAEGGAREPH